ncbi:GreA/GreB family elongation factor [Kiritimatiellota bacterium B12222]|nr:GreA/GreB family elongation factor [Kiritimatiellota bacterium B12222]
MSEFSEVLMLECLEKNPPDLTPILGSLTVLFRDDPETAEAHAKLIRLQLVEKGAYAEVVKLYQIMADWYSADRNWRKTVQRDLSKAFEADPLQLMLLNLSGMENPRLKAKEALRRLEMLSALSDGDYVFMKNFGFGKVIEVRHSDRRLVVDFTEKPNHELDLGFAAEKMVRVDEDHLYARRYLNPEKMEEMVKGDPAEVVRIALRSFGPTAAPQLQAMFVPDIFPDAKWKTFWANARKDLKKDPLVVLPSKRSEPLELLDTEKSYDGNWFWKLGELRNMEAILNELEECLSIEVPQLDEGAYKIVVDRLRFVVIGAKGKHFDYLVRCWLIATKLDIPVEEIELTSFLATAKTPDGLLSIVGMLSANLTKAFFAELSRSDTDAAADVLIKVLPQLEYSALNEAISLLTEEEKEERVATALREVWNQWSAEVDVMFWLSQNSKKITEWNYGGTPDLVARVLKVINRDYTGNRLRVRNQLREVFRKPVWLKEVLSSMDERQRRAFTQGVKDSTAWEQLDKASVLGQIVKLEPSVSDIVSGKTEDQSADLAERPKVSSFRIYREKEAQLHKLITKDIPENTKDIAVAREYGDLRENFEYKAAKDTQRLLMGRRGELENQLRTVKPTDFSEFSSDEAGIATTVTIKFNDGEEATYHILGEWDSEPERDIIAIGSAMAIALEGKKAGDEVVVPSENGKRPAVIQSVSHLDAEIMRWAAEGSETGAE